MEDSYPLAVCTLEYDSAYKLLVATRLAAQCTDKRVNLVTKKLFRKYPDLESLAHADHVKVMEIIKPCGFYRTKASNIINICKMLLEEFNSVVPDKMESLLKLPGVGRKTANLILGDIYGKPAVVVDTHCLRITKRLGLHSSKNPIVVEKVLKQLLPAYKSNSFCHRLVMHGRSVCKALSPRCGICCMKDFCAKDL